MWRLGQVPLMSVAYSWMLEQVGDALGVQPGEEFRVALLEAQQVCPLCPACSAEADVLLVEQRAALCLCFS
jgi:pheromone shutdown protein TraB